MSVRTNTDTRQERISRESVSEMPPTYTGSHGCSSMTPQVAQGIGLRLHLKVWRSAGRRSCVRPMKASHQAEIPKAGVFAPVPYHDVIKNLDPQHIPGFHKTMRKLDIGPGWSRIAAWVVVHDHDRSG